MKTEARAKINLCLAVRGKAGSMHILDGIFAPIDLSDDVEIVDSDFLYVEYADGRTYERDNALRIAEKLTKRYGLPPFGILITKRIPEGKGLGGSSADAGAVARLVKEKFSLPEIDGKILLETGSDVPFAYFDCAARVQGLGDSLKKIVLPEYRVCLLVPEKGVSTKACFDLYDETGGEEPDVESVESGDFTKIGNALTRAACLLEPSVEEGLETLRSCGFVASMTGSGSAVFGIETDENEFIRKAELTIKRADKKFKAYVM